MTVNAFFGIGKWKGVLSEHAELLMNRSEAIASGDTKLVADYGKELETNRLRWTKGRRVTTEKLRERVKIFNDNVKIYAENLKEARDIGLTVSTVGIQKSSQNLATFFAKGRIETVFASPKDYAEAFETYGFSLTHHALYADQYAFRKNAADLQQRNAKRDTCHRVATALGSLLNGASWTNPIKVAQN